MIPIFNKPLECCLKVAGFWPYDFNMLGPVAITSMLVTTLPFQCWNAFALTENLVVLMDSLSDIFTEVLIYIKIFILWNHRREIRDLLEEIGKDWSIKSIPTEWENIADYCRIICNIDVIVYASASILYYPDLLMSYFGKPVNERHMLFQSYYPFDYRRSPIYEVINIVYFFQGILMIIADSVSKTLFISMIFHVSSQIYELRNNLEQYSRHSNDGYENKNFKRLKLVVQQHLKILSLVRRIDHIYSYVALFQIVFSSIIICVTGFVIITAMESANIMLLVKFMTFIIAMLAQVSYFCFAGQYLLNKGESIVEMINSSFWYNSQCKDVKVLIFVLTNAQKPLTVSGANIFNLSAETFTMIVKTSASYLSVLRAMYTQ
ncbi:odorant receptor 66 [Nasonia vitripennis]|uniref:Odorant receptor n=1 Tax=Nasonia vitripennis TaxID=7425 RepID=A0A7M6UE02_NASVI|nr:odorant receptor 66 [Nasonia vitripennis]